ncbi:MAG: hypothetical protein ACI9S8_003104 [Chlamydiales bacterium]|jgi:hypothetical protein
MYESNLKKFKEHYPSTGEKIENDYIQDLEFCETRLGERNLKYHEEGRTTFIHSSYSAKKETKKWRASLDLSGIKVLIVYGIGLAYSFHELKEWLESNSENHLLYLEDDLRVLKSFLHLPYAEEIFNHPQVQIFEVHEDKEIRKRMFNELVLYFNMIPRTSTSLPFYNMNKAELYYLYRQEILDSFNLLRLTQDEYLSFGSSYLMNFYSIILSLDKSFIGDSLQNCFRNVPAIICGAGPSLEKNVFFLKTLQNRALILAPGSSIIALEKHDIEPHLGGSGDASPIQYGRMVSHSHFELPMIYKSRTNHKAFRSFHGPRIYSYGNTQYPILDQIENHLSLKGHALDNGMSMQQHITEWACYMGCNPIIYVGLDLALTDNKTYSNGIDSEGKIKEFASQENCLLLDACVERNDIYGKKVHTYSKWIYEAEMSSLFPKKYPNHTFINSTEGGLGIDGISNTPLHTVAEKYLNRTYDLKSLIHTKLHCRESKKVAFTDIVNEIYKVKNAFEKTLADCSKLKKTIEKVIDRLKNKPQASFQKNLTIFIELKKELYNDPMYKLFIKPINIIRHCTFERQIREAEADKSIRSDNQRFTNICNIYLNEINYDISACKAHLEAIDQSTREFCRHGYGSLTAYFKKLMEKTSNAKVKL